MKGCQKLTIENPAKKAKHQFPPFPGFMFRSQVEMDFHFQFLKL